MPRHSLVMEHLKDARAVYIAQFISNPRTANRQYLAAVEELYSDHPTIFLGAIIKDLRRSLEREQIA